MAADDAESAPEGGLEVRDLNVADEKPYLTKPTSQVDLERRLADDYKADGDLSRRVTVNPDPFGEETDNGQFVGTDPIYQGRANETEQPLQAEEGPDKKAEEAFAELFESDGEKVPDYGTGGEAVRAADPTQVPDVERRLVPGQEGYPDNVASGPTVSASSVQPADESETQDDDDAADQVEEAQPDSQPQTSPAAPVTQSSPTPPFGGGQQNS